MSDALKHEQVWIEEALARLKAFKEGRASARDAWDVLADIRGDG